ncbi:MAG: hypothetical protein ABJB98_07335 [Actinomycetota bacterium]
MKISKRTRLVSLIAATGAAATAVTMALTTTPAQGTPSTGTGTTTLLSRATLANQTILNTRAVQLHTFQPVDVAVFHSVVEAGWTSGWHSHPGPVLVAVKSGSLQFKTANCATTTVTAGQVYPEGAGVPIKATALTAAEWYTTMLIPAGAKPRNDQPGACGS